jgi:fructuronate reductase
VTRLSTATLADLPADVARPPYDRSAIGTGVVHLGIGAFHRAHQAAIFDAALAAGDVRWGVLGVSLRSPAVRDQLGPQHGLYSLVERDGSGDRVRIIGAVRGVLVAPENPAAVVAALAAPDTHIVTLTITEKGYKLIGGTLDAADSDVAHDLADLARPRTAPGFIVAALAARRAAGLSPFTTLSCDNLPHNGILLRDAVLAMARAHDADLADWIADQANFPQTMVDRIVPATTDADIAALAQRLGVEDRTMVKAEPFLQWVIEDRFCGPRPEFETLGVQITRDVAPWEEAKLRLLNGAHSGIAYLGGLTGLEFVDQFVALPQGQAFIEALWNESAATLSPPPGLDLAAYRAALMARFANPALLHRTRQIAMDGSQKLPQRLLAPLVVQLQHKRSIGALALAVAAWMRWQCGQDDLGRPHRIDDPLADLIHARLAEATTTEARVDALLAIDAIVPAALAINARLREALVDRLALLETIGAERTLARLEMSW